MKLFRPETILLVLFLVGMAFVPMASAVPNMNTSEQIELDEPLLVPQRAATLEDGYELIFSGNNFKSSSVQYFNSGNTIPAGTYTLTVTGWDSRWSYDYGWWEEGVRTVACKFAAYDNLTSLWIEGQQTTPLLTIVNGTFARENSTGSAIVVLTSASRTGIIIQDDTYGDNRGSAIFVLKKVNPPVANFTGDPLSGNRPLTVQFNDTSTGSPTSWEWDFDNDGIIDSTDQNPQHTYNEIGSYSVNLTVTNAAEKNTMTKNGYITVTGYYYVYADGVALYYDGLNTPTYEANPIAIDFYNNITGKQGSVYSSFVWQGIANPTDNATGSRNWNENEDANSMVNNADFALHAGHGWDDGIKFGIENYSYDANREDLSFGGNHGRAKWVALFSCSVLKEASHETWTSVFNGLHILMGFDTDGVLAADQGAQFAQRMTGGGIYDETKIIDAWVATLKETVDDVSVRGAYMHAYPSEEDYLPGFGTFREPQKNSVGQYNITYRSFDCGDV